MGFARHTMGTCTSSAKEDSKRLAVAKMRQTVVKDSPSIVLHCTSLHFTRLQAHEAQTVLELLEMVAEKMGLPKRAATWMKLIVNGAIISPLEFAGTLREAGVSDQTQFSVQGEYEARAKVAEQMDIHTAAERGDANGIQFLLTVYPDKLQAMDRNRLSPLHKAVIFNKVQVAKVLLEADADVNALDRFGNTPLHKASYKNNSEMTELLIAAGADVTAKNTDGIIAFADTDVRADIKIHRNMMKLVQPNARKALESSAGAA